MSTVPDAVEEQEEDTMSILGNGRMGVSRGIAAVHCLAVLAILALASCAGEEKGSSGTVPTSWAIGGTIAYQGEGCGGVPVTLSGAADRATTTDGDGMFLFTSLPAGAYTLSPAFPAQSFSPLLYAVDLAGPSSTGNDFSLVPNVRFVDSGASGKANGVTWVDAFLTIREGIANAVSGQDVWVAQGAYPAAAGTVTVPLKRGVDLYGGFDGESDPSDRAPASRGSVLSGTGASRPLVEGWGVNVTLDGFTLSGVNAPLAAVSVDGSTLTFSNCAFAGNSCANVISASDGLTTLRGCDFTGNRAECLYNYVSDAVVSSCSFSDNSGRGIYGTLANVLVRNSTFRNHGPGAWAVNFGGGAILHNYSAIEIRDCLFEGNRSNFSGGAVNIRYAAVATVADNVFRTNRTAALGGALQSFDSPTVVTNCVFEGNESPMAGGAMLGASDTVHVVNCTFVGNKGGTNGGGVNSNTGNKTYINNCLFWMNSTDDIYDLYGEAHVSGSLYQDWKGVANLLEYPGFLVEGYWDLNDTPTDTSDDLWVAGDYHLLATSPCIDAGAATLAPAEDIEGTVRPSGDGYDVGAYEYQSP